MKDAAEILADSREFIEIRGWVRGTLVDAGGRVCSLGGIVFSQQWDQEGEWNDGNEYADEVNYVMTFLILAMGFDPEDYPGNDATSKIVSWNDNLAEGQQQVLDIFAKAEKIALGLDPDAA